MALSLLHLSPDPLALTHWATRRHWLSPDGDFGYALHALLADAFQGQPPTPFHYMGQQGLLAYTSESETALRDRITAASPEAQQVLRLDRLRLRPFPSDWPSGKRLAFEVRVRPILRTNSGKERDLYQYRMEQQPAASSDPPPTREHIYRQWLEQRLTSDNAAQLRNASLQGFALRRVLRRGEKGDHTSPRKANGINGPDALFHGELEVNDSQAFARLLAHGIGRHRAFGYGMLLLRPASGG